MIDIKRLDLVIGNQNKKKLYFITFLILFQSLIEVLGIGMIFPLISFFADSQSFEIPFNFEFIDNFLLTNNKETISIFIILGFIFIFFIKFLIQSYVAWYTLTYFNNLRLYISKKIIEKHFNFLERGNSIIRDSGQFSNLVLLESERYAFKYVGCLVNLAAEIITILFISILLFFVSSKNSVVVLIFYSSVIFVIYYFIRNYLKKIGEKRIFHNEIAFMNVKDGFAGFKEIIIYDAVEKFKNNFIKNFSKLTNITRNESFLQHIPRLIIELLTISIFCSVIFFVFLVLKLDFTEIAPILGLYAFAALRIYPAVTRILANLSALRVTAPVEKKLVKFLASQNEKILLKNKEINFNKEILIRNLSYSINDKSIIENINFEINKNEFIGIYGESGVGKSTLFNLLMGFLEPSSGEIKIDDENLNYETFRSWISKVCYVGQDIFILNDTVENNIALSSKSLSEKKLLQSIKSSQLESFISRGNTLKTILSEEGANISGGERQRIAVARAYYKDAEIFFLDEATSSLDEETSKNLIHFINELKGKKTILFISHKKENLKNCDKIIEIKNKNITINNN